MELNNQNNFIKHLNLLIESTKLNFSLDSKFVDDKYIDTFFNKLKTSDLINYPLYNRFKSFEEVCTAIEVYKTKISH
jgi:hypothetical protein